MNIERKLLTRIGIAVVAAVIIALVIWKFPGGPGVTPDDGLKTLDPRNATYHIDNKVVPLKNGEAYVQIEPGVTTHYKYFSQAEGLLNEDEVDDAGVILTAEPGGSGTFFYAVALVSTPGGFQGTNGILLGDRIAPQTIDVGNDKFEVNYAIRKPGEPFTTAPSVGVTKYFQVRKGTFVEVKK